jgi:hypothetical protein
LKGISEEKIQVISYSGYRGEETPRAFTHNQEKIEVIDILSRWVEEAFKERGTKRFFTCKGSDGGIHNIFYDEKSEEWYYKR